MYDLCPQHVSEPHINPCEQVKEVALVWWGVRAPSSSLLMAARIPLSPSTGPVLSASPTPTHHGYARAVGPQTPAHGAA